MVLLRRNAVALVTALGGLALKLTNPDLDFSSNGFLENVGPYSGLNNIFNGEAKAVDIVSTLALYGGSAYMFYNFLVGQFRRP